MQCRARAGAQAFKYVWTTDDVLADAFTRFIRVSKAGRRYGSHVPGPMEARRRGAKRTMGMAASVVEFGNTGLNPGLLSSFRLPTETQSPEENWQWTAPDPPRSSIERAQQSQVSDFWDIKDDVQAIGIYTKGVKKSVEDFQALLDAVDTSTAFTKAILLSVLRYLQGSEDQPEAHNTLRLVHWLSGRDVAGDVWKEMGETMVVKIKAGNMDVNEVQAMMEMWTSKIEELDMSPIFSVMIEALDALDIPDLKRVVWVTTKNLADLPNTQGEHLEPVSDGQQPAMPRVLKSWLAVLRKSSSMQRQGTDGVVWRAIYRYLSAKFDVSALADHLGQLEQLGLARVLLRHYVPRSRHENDTWLNTGKTLRLTTRERPVIRVKALLAQFEELVAQQPNIPLRQVLAVLFHNGLPNHDVASAIFETISKSWGPPAVLDYIKSLELGNGRFVPIPPKLAIEMVNYLVQVRTPTSLQLAMAITEWNSTVALSAIPELLPTLIQSGFCGSAWSDRIFKVLNRKRPEDAVPPSQRIRARLRLNKDVVVLVHRLAEAFAHAPGLTPRVAFRRVWACYRFLHDRGAPTNASLSRALVQAGLLKFLDAGVHIPSEQARYILSIVEVHEGKERARRVDEALFIAMREMDQPIPSENENPTAAPSWRHRTWRADSRNWFQDGRNLKRLGEAQCQLSEVTILADASKPGNATPDAKCSVSSQSYKYSAQSSVQTTPRFAATKTSNFTLPAVFSEQEITRSQLKNASSNASSHKASTPAAPIEAPSNLQAKDVHRQLEQDPMDEIVGEVIGTSISTAVSVDEQTSHMGSEQHNALTTNAGNSGAAVFDCAMRRWPMMTDRPDMSAKAARLNGWNPFKKDATAEVAVPVQPSLENSVVPTRQPSERSDHEGVGQAAGGKPTPGQTGLRKYTKAQRRARTAGWEAFDKAWAARRERITGEKREVFTRDLGGVD